MKYLHQVDTDLMLSLQAPNVMIYVSFQALKERRFSTSFLKAPAVFL